MCNLASIVLPKFVSTVGEEFTMPSHGEIYHLGTDKDKATLDPSASMSQEEQEQAKGAKGYLFDHQRLYEVTKVMTRNLNKIIDINYYPVPEARNSNKRHRPIGTK